MQMEQRAAFRVIQPEPPAHPPCASAPAGQTAEVRGRELAWLSLGLLVRRVHRWWLQRVERHCLICADVEAKSARQAQLNVAYYQKQAALARSARL